MVKQMCLNASGTTRTMEVLQPRCVSTKDTYILVQSWWYIDRNFHLTSLFPIVSWRLLWSIIIPFVGITRSHLHLMTMEECTSPLAPLLMSAKIGVLSDIRARGLRRMLKVTIPVLNLLTSQVFGNSAITSSDNPSRMEKESRQD